MVFSLSPRSCTAPAAEFQSGASKTRVLRCLGSQRHQKRRVFSCLGRDGSDGQACHVPGASGASKSAQKAPKGRPCDVSFNTFLIQKRHPERDGSQVAFSTFCCGFLEGPTLDPLAPAQSKRSFSCSTWPLKGCRF